MEYALVDKVLDRFPEEVLAQKEKYASLDFSDNKIGNDALSSLAGFERLESLVLDTNELDEDMRLPKLESLKTLSLNGNRISKLEGFLHGIQESCPNLDYLSLMKNPVSPGFVADDKNQQYRREIISVLDALKFLDFMPVTVDEKERARVHAKAVSDPSSPGKSKKAAKELKRLPDEEEGTRSGTGHYGKVKYVYYGRQSEGNRMITNSML